jgi:hypothetical protein
MREVDAAHMAERDAVGRCPQTLARLACRGVRRQPLQVQPWARPMRQERPAHSAARHGCPLPQADQAATDLTPPLCHKGHHSGGVHGVVWRMNVACARGRDDADGRQLLPGLPCLHDWGLADWRIGAPDAGPRVNPRRLSAAERRRLRLGPCVLAGPVSSCQRAMAASARCRARRAGVCGRQRITSSRRPTWRGGSATPHAKRLRAATRRRVHRAPRQP